MRNPSEILKLAVGGGHYYRPSKPDQPLTPQSFMCIALDSMFHSGVITAEEFEQTAAAVVGYVRELSDGQAAALSVALYVAIKGGRLPAITVTMDALMTKIYYDWDNRPIPTQGTSS